MPGRRRDSSGEVWSVMLRIGLAGLALAAGMFAAAAQEMKSPPITPTHADWDAVAADLGAVEPGKPAAAPELMAKLNHATGERFPNIAASPVPVLLPFDTAAFLSDRASGLDQGKPSEAYLSGFRLTKFFYPGPSGYDAAFTVRASEVPGLTDLQFSDQADLLISGSSVLYDLNNSGADQGKPVPALESEFPGIRRLLVESHVRYTFVRYGVPYMVSLLCFDGGIRAHRLSCRQADRIAVRFLQSLTVVGGMPQPRPGAKAPRTVERPAALSPDFTFYGPGQLIAGTGVRGNGGRVDYTVYAKIRFPFASAPAYANSQSFMNWGDCDHTGRVPAGVHTKDAPYHCRVNDKPLVFDEAKNFTYPWQDNFCEHRWFFVGQCPGGAGHQGQDIRPGDCQLRNEGADRCIPYLHDVVAVRDGMVLRNSKQEGVILFVNAPGEHLRFRQPLRHAGHGLRAFDRSARNRDQGGGDRRGASGRHAKRRQVGRRSGRRRRRPTCATARRQSRHRCRSRKTPQRSASPQSDRARTPALHPQVPAFVTNSPQFAPSARQARLPSWRTGSIAVVASG
jgi:hypothetical protein